MLSEDGAVGGCNYILVDDVPTRYTHITNLRREEGRVKYWSLQDWQNKATEIWPKVVWSKLLYLAKNSRIRGIPR